MPEVEERMAILTHLNLEMQRELLVMSLRSLISPSLSPVHCVLPVSAGH